MFKGSKKAFDGVTPRASSTVSTLTLSRVPEGNRNNEGSSGTMLLPSKCPLKVTISILYEVQTSKTISRQTSCKHILNPPHHILAELHPTRGGVVFQLLGLSGTDDAAADLGAAEDPRDGELRHAAAGVA